MPAIANYPDRCELLNLGYGPQGRGPFVIRQEGNVPGAMDLRQNTYLLRKDGVWVLNYSVFTLPEAEQAPFMYQSTAEAMAMMSGLTGAAPVIESALPPGKSLAELQASTEATASRLLTRLRQAKREPITPRGS